MLTGKEQPERVEPRLRTARRGVSVETRPPARAVCRIPGARTGAGQRLGGERAGCGQKTDIRKGGPTRLARAGQGWRMGSSGCVSRSRDGRTCGREGAGGSSRGGAQPLIAASEGASLCGNGAGTGFASNGRRGGDPGVQFAAAIVCVMAGQARMVRLSFNDGEHVPHERVTVHSPQWVSKITNQ